MLYHEDDIQGAEIEIDWTGLPTMSVIEQLQWVLDNLVYLASVRYDGYVLVRANREPDNKEGD